MTLAELFKTIRLELGLDQIPMSLLLGVRQPAVSKIEAGVMAPSAHAFLMLWRATANHTRARRTIRRFLDAQ